MTLKAASFASRGASPRFIGSVRVCSIALKDAGPPTGPDQQWAGDITYLQVQWRYLSVALDLYSRKIISWTLCDRRTVDLTYRAMQAAIERRQPLPGLIFHTDRGIEYRSLAFWDFLTTHHIIASMNRPAQTTDNAFVESFFHTLKAEFFRGDALIRPRICAKAWPDISITSTIASGCTRTLAIVHLKNMSKLRLKLDGCLFFSGKIRAKAEASAARSSRAGAASGVAWAGQGRDGDRPE